MSYGQIQINQATICIHAHIQCIQLRAQLGRLCSGSTQTQIYIYIYFWADAPRRLRRIPRPAISSQCGLESFWMWTCFRNIFLMFFEKRSWNRTGTLLEIDGFFGEQVSSRKLLPRVFPEELLPISTCYFV